MTSRENVSEDDIINNYKNWYYILDIQSVIDNLIHNCNYYHPIQKNNTHFPYELIQYIK